MFEVQSPKTHYKGKKLVSKSRAKSQMGPDQVSGRVSIPFKHAIIFVANAL